MGWKLPGVTAKFAALVVIFLLTCLLFLVYQINHPLITATLENCSRALPTPSVERHDSGRKLVDAIKEATRTASGKVDIESLSTEEKEAWDDRHPCKSRGPLGLVSHYNYRAHVASLPANPLWDEVFEEYSKLHRVCTQKVGDLREYFLQKNISSGCKFVVADIADWTGFGNKILVLASSLLYAVVTRRVLLIPASTLVPSSMCEPFPGSSWVLNKSSSFPIPPTSFKDLWMLDKEIFTAIDRNPCSLPSIKAPVYAAGIRTNQWQPQQRFYCAHEQAAYSQVTFVYLSGCVYTIPKLFATPMFRPALEALFPDRVVITRLLRSAFLPANPVWERVRGLDQAYLHPADRRVGIQLRYNGRGLPSYQEMNDVVNKRIVDCLIGNNILPNVSDSWEKPFSPGRPVIQVFIASLFTGLKDHLSGMYVRHQTVTGEGVGLVQVTSNGNQEFGLEEDVEAFTEVLLLSFSDHLLVTPVSTLGTLAHAYGALTPWFIDVRKNSKPDEYGACERGQTIEACNQFSQKKYSCSRDPSVDGKLLSDVVPYIENCLTIDHAEGIQLITSF